MIDRTISSLTDLAQEICQAFLVPGEILLSAIGALSPRTTEILSFGHGGTVVTFVFALIIWTLILIAGLMISKWVRKFAWQVAAIFRTLVWRAKMYAGSLKTKLIWKYRGAPEDRRLVAM